MLLLGVMRVRRVWMKSPVRRFAGAGPSLGENDTKAGAVAFCNRSEAGTVGLAELARDVQAEPGALAGGREERLHDPVADVGAQPRPVVGDIQPEQPRTAVMPAQAYTQRRLVAAGMTLCVVPEIEQQLAQMAGVEFDAQGGVDADDLEVGRAGIVLAIVVHAAGQPVRERDRPARGLGASRQPQNAVDDVVDPARVAVHDIQQTPAVGVQRRGLGQQLAGVTDRPERIADLVRDAAGQPPQGDELELLGLLTLAQGILQADQHQCVPRRAQAGEQR
ncbi:hypothetical protein SAOR_08760 [Salinisphaera orenii MK-B5]|uniref:Uncharacterized protein n=1 Tax=Salinisphaera orenii MK-B5 TaxID=856730 RepID=A0A423PP09_9GAMM|nr:hypothetical protein [Salinisphaera orenii]ROO27292.1 hypothetical protein SAOR_08760 [Salinisphaera orenii MK-B5]